MPNPEAKMIPIWPHYCQTVYQEDEGFTLKSEPDENCILQIIGGNIIARYHSKEYTLTVQNVMMLGRNTSVEINVTRGPVRYLLLRYKHTYTSPSFDLNHMCLQNPSVDTFLGGKGRFCVLEDRENIHLVLNDLHNEWEHARLERDSMIYHKLYELFIRMARCFHEHRQPNGVKYLNRACAFIKDNYQRNLTLDEVAAQVGVSRSYLTLLFKTWVNRTFVSYVQAVRCDRAAYLLKTSSFAIVDIAAEAGFNSRQHFTRTFRQIYGLTPDAYRRAYHAAYQ